MYYIINVWYTCHIHMYFGVRLVAGLQFTIIPALSSVLSRFLRKKLT
jgi:hypothetical protein